MPLMANRSNRRWQNPTELIAAEYFAGIAKADTLVMRQLQRQRLDLEFLLRDDLFALDQQLLVLLVLRQQCTYLRDNSRVGIGAGQLFEQVHAGMLTE